jgi:hypothetical protein
MARNDRLPSPRNNRAETSARRPYANPTPAANARAARTPRNPLLPPPEIVVISLRSAGSVLYFGDRSLGVRLAKVVFDSGSSFTYFAAKPYQALVTAVGLKPSSPVTQMNRE